MRLGALLLAAAALTATAQPIERSAKAVAAFKRANPCPATGRPRGPCPGYHVDHSTPLCAGGLDHPSNMAWLREDDHHFKTVVDIRECRKLRRAANTPAQ